jgi:hypothetical protein
MDREQRVVVVLPMRYLVNGKRDTYAARVPELGLTGYGTTMDEAKQKVKRMFAAFVVAHRKRGLLSDVLDGKKMTWCWEKDYDGDVELFSPDGKIETLHCKTQHNHPWELIGELAIA